MARFKGFCTIDRYKSYTMTDRELVIRDLMNALSIRGGTVPGKPEVGCQIWDYIFEPITEELETRITDEIERIIDTDPRISLVSLTVSTYDNSIYLDVLVKILDDVEPEKLVLEFSEKSESVQLV